jgi:glycosyltransferase involved in cell wall biosynthesis
MPARGRIFTDPFSQGGIAALMRSENALLGNTVTKTVRILGTHGVPANYGGFETAAENVARYLLAHGWRVIVYCQVEGEGPIVNDKWQGIERVSISVARDGWLGTSRFDWLSIKHASRFNDICLTFGYNTGIFNIWQRLRGIPNVINMDGIEWSRARWGFSKQAILYINERFSALFGNHLIADHPEIEKYLWTRAPMQKISTITYGANTIVDPDERVLDEFDLEKNTYFTLIARPIPENSILEIVKGFSAHKRGVKLVVFGGYKPEADDYHRLVTEAASDEVVFVGGVYEPERVEALRYFSLGYLHGHTVGGTNPSLVEALAAGNPVIAHDNVYNRWVAQDAGLYFTTEDDVSRLVSTVLEDTQQAQAMKSAAIARYESEFTWDRVAGQYEELLTRYLRKNK